MIQPETIFHILFSRELTPKGRIAMLFALTGGRNDSAQELELWGLKISGSSLEFYHTYLKRLLSEFSFIKQLKWRRYWAPEELGDPPDSLLDVFINEVEFNFYSSRYDYFHPYILPVVEDFSAQRIAPISQEWHRFMDSFILFNDINFIFSQPSKVAPADLGFQLIEYDDWYTEEEYIGMGELEEFKLTREGNDFLCTVREYDPPPPLPPK